MYKSKENKLEQHGHSGEANGYGRLAHTVLATNLNITDSPVGRVLRASD